MESTKNELLFGFPEEWEDFGRRHPLFLERFPRLLNAVSTAILRDVVTSELIDRFVLLYGRLCCEDFSEVLLCCGNGYGNGAAKLLRSLYERAVTLRYLHEHPEEFEAFMDFHHIANRKLVVSAEETFGKELLTADARAKLESEYESVKDKFMVTHCKECGTKRLSHTWNKLDLVSMAKKVGGDLGGLVVPAYYMPLRQAHATFGSLLSRLEEGESDGILFNHAAQKKEADYTLMTTHHVMLEVLKVQEAHFKVPGLAGQIEECFKDFVEIYSKKKPNEQAQ